VFSRYDFKEKRSQECAQDVRETPDLLRNASSSKQTGRSSRTTPWLGGATGIAYEEMGP
jgi:hypothetical protein